VEHCPFELALALRKQHGFWFDTGWRHGRADAALGTHYTVRRRGAGYAAGYEAGYHGRELASCVTASETASEAVTDGASRSNVLPFVRV
jgi:ribosome modulation factor